MPGDYRSKLRDLTLMLAGSITIIGTTAIAAGLPQMSDRFAATAHGAYLVRISLTLPALSAGLFAPLMGMIVDRWGRRRLFILAAVSYGVTGCAGFFLTSLYAILASRFLLGIAVSAVATCATTLIADYSHRGGFGSAMGRQSLFMALGNMVFVFMGGLLATHGWRWPFLIYAVAFLLLPGIIFLIREPPRAAALSATATAPAFASSLDDADDVLRASIGKMAFVYGLLFVNMIVYFMVPVYLPFYLKSFSHSSSVKTGTMLSLVGLAWAISSTQYKRLERNFSYEQIVIITFAVLGVADVLLGSASTYLLAVPVMLLVGAGLGCAIPNLNAWLMWLAPARVKGRVIGTRVFFTFLGQFLSPVLTQPITSAFGISRSYQTAGVLLLVIAVGVGLYLSARARRPGREPARPARSTAKAAAGAGTVTKEAGT